MRWGLFLLLGLLLLLPAWPPLLRGAAEGALALLGLQGRVGEARGHLLLGLRLKGVELRGEGLEVWAEEVRLAYDLLGLLRRELPLSLHLKGARLRPTWEALFPEGPPGPPPRVRPLFRQLLLEEAEVELPQGERLFLPPLRLTLQGGNPYAFLARLPGGSFRGEARALAPDLGAWEVAFRGEVRGLAFFYEGLKGGTLSGVLRLGPGGLWGEARVAEGAVELVGFPLTGVEGPIRLAEDRVVAELRGVGLEGPLEARAEVDLRAEGYRFRVEGRPRLAALARHFGLALPVEGAGDLLLEGEGWEEVRVQGGFQGEGRLLGEPFRHRGRLAFHRVFALEAEAEGRLFDRDYRLALDLRGGEYRVEGEDSRGSRLLLRGQGERARGEGVLAWPLPLEGRAQVAFALEGGRWQARVASPGVALPLFRPLDLSGAVAGEGERVSGQLGPLALGGTWGDLALRLAATPLAVGHLEGEGRLLQGRLWAALRYASPFAALGVQVVQEAEGFRFLSPFGEGRYREGTLALVLRDLPVRALEEFRLSGEALYREGALAGSLALKGRYLEAEARLRRLGAEIAGRLWTPWGEVPFGGSYDPEPGLALQAQGLRLAYREGARLWGEAALGPLALRADLLWDGGFAGWAEAEAYGVRGTLRGAGERLLLALSGAVAGEGEVWPEPRLAGRLRPPLPEGLELPPLAFRLEREGLEVLGVGRVAFREGWPFALELPFRYRGLEGRLLAAGGLEGGRVALRTPYGEVAGEGPWRELALLGRLEVPHGGPGRLSGRLDLPGLAYRGEVYWEGPGLRLGFQGEGASLRLAGEAPGLRLLGGYGEGGLSLEVRAEGYDLAPWGLPLRATGVWGTEGGRLRLVSPYGEALAVGEELLAARVRLSGPYLEGEGRVSPEGVSLALAGGYGGDGAGVRLWARGGGPWGALALDLGGEAWAPYLEPVAFRGRVWWAEGVRYLLEGPVHLQGEGLRYRGGFALPVALLGREGGLWGEFWGEGLALEGAGEGELGGLPFAFRGGYGEGAFLRLAFPGGEVALEGEEVGFRVADAGPLMGLLGLPLSGEAWGRLTLEGEGEAWARLRYGEEALLLDYREGVLRLHLPLRDLGLAWAPGEGRLWGLGALQGEGRLRLGGEGEVLGAFRLGGVEARLAGSLRDLEAEARLLGEGLGESAFAGRLDLLGLEGEGVFRHASAYGEGEVALLWEGARYRGEGWLRGLRYLEQEGPLRLWGEGGRVEATWEAPLAFAARYHGALQLGVRGEGEVLGFRVGADLAYGPEGYRGRLEAQGRGLRLLAEGEGPLRLSLLGEGLPGEVRAEGVLEGLSLRGEARYALPLGQARLLAEARLQGELPRFLLEGEGAVLGEGEALPFRFAYAHEGGGPDPGALALWGEASGFRLRLEGGRLSLHLDRDLAPFGLPLGVRARAEGPWDGPIGVVLERPEGRLSGRVWPWPLRAELAGEVLGERVEAAYGEEGAVLRFLGPVLAGEARYGRALSGLLALRYPLPGGGLRGEVDLAQGTFRLLGEGEWRGEVRGAFCLPAPLGGCPGLEAQAQGELAHGPLALRLDHGYRAEAGYLGALLGEGRLLTPYGEVLLRGRGLGLDLLGEGLPLWGRLDLLPFRLLYRYAGPLPLGLGELWAEGAYPGEWLRGRYRLGEVALDLQGLPGFRVALRGEGLWGEVGPEGLALRAEGFAYGPLRVFGWAAGPWERVEGELALAAFGREARVRGAYGREGLRLAFAGDLEGEVAWREVWEGRLAFREGFLEVFGEGVPGVRGEVLGEGVGFRWPLLEAGGVRVDLQAREASGEGRLLAGLVPGGLQAQGAGREVRLGYRVPGLGLPLEGVLDLRDLSLALVSPEGEGALRYAGGRVEGAWALEVAGLALRLLGEGERVRLLGEHPPWPWWAAGAGALEGEVDLGGSYRLGYRAGAQVLELTGRLLEATLQAEGPYLQGRLAYPPSGELRVELPLPPLAARFRGRVFGEGYGVEGVLEGEVGRVEARGRLWPLAGELLLEGAALEDFLAPYAPYLKGRVSGRLALEGLEARGSLRGQVEAAGTALPLAFSGALGPGRLWGEGSLGQSRFQVELLGGRLDLAAALRAFPLHLPLAAVAGPLEGEAYWTGQARLRLPLADPWEGEGVLVGESLRFLGAGDELRGRAALRFQGGRVHVDHLRLAGRGTWEGGGYFGPGGSDLYLSLRDTAFTPVLGVIPALRPYRPEASGSLTLRLGAEGFRAEFQDFRFRLGPVAGYLERGLLSLNGGARAEGELLLQAPFPGRAGLGLEGRLEDFRVTARGTVSLPGLQEAIPAEVAFRYPGYGVEIRLGGALAQGTLFPLRLAGYGPLPLYYPQYYLQEGLLDVKGFFLYEERGTYYLTGNAEVVRARLALPEARVRQLTQEGVPWAGPPEGQGSAPVPLVFEGVRIYAERGVLVQESLVQGELRGELFLGGTYADPFLAGEVEALWGSFRLLDSLFTLDPARSVLRFRPDRGLLPEFALRAQAETRGYQVVLEASGEFLRENGRVKARLEPRFASEPPLSEPEIYALLALGTPDLARLGEALPQAALGAALETLVLGQLERELARALGLDRVQLQVPLLQGGEVGDIRFSIGKYLSPELFLGYAVDLRGGQALSAQYRQDGFTFAFSSTFFPGNGRFPRLAFAVGYDLTPALGLTFSLEAADATRFSVGALYRW
ncbi:translocation/assembly module TamB domain-containing protein [Thermus thermamylovorans]|uniref:Translocation/assembly module TamB n=1 Tax=Thermus thermamylovorans TaxID=2509362 RepID=A0A4Q9B283_9DEIN|nr:translocation/assembly module TamB domain-containing protein [Thermus thermamylovorans]TBH17389.1 translocation/assembly module TamB [Thermus thermamylovorans]